VSQQEFSYFDPEQETVYEPRNINRDPRESREGRQEQEQIVYYVTPEQSMLRGEKLIPAHRTKSHASWIATAVFLLMILFGGFLWGQEVRPFQSIAPVPFHHKGEFHPGADRDFHEWNKRDPHMWGDDDSHP